MKKLSLIACVGKDLGLGFKNDLLWKIPADQKFFRQTTLNHPIIMGGNTYRSIGRPLPKRENVVLSRTPVDEPSVVWCQNLEELQRYLAHQTETVYVIGGAKLYEMFIRQADELILTEVDAAKPADVFFPEFNRDDYERTVLQSGMTDGVKYQMVQYLRKQNA